MSTEQQTLTPPTQADVVLVSQGNTAHRKLAPGVTGCSANGHDLDETPATTAAVDPDVSWCKTCYDEPEYYPPERRCPALAKYDDERFDVREWAQIDGFRNSQPCAVCFPDGDPTDEVLALTGQGRNTVHDPEGDR